MEGVKPEMFFIAVDKGAWFPRMLYTKDIFFGLIWKWPLCMGGGGTTEHCSSADFFLGVLSTAIQEGGFWWKSRMAFHYSSRCRCLQQSYHGVTKHEELDLLGNEKEGHDGDVEVVLVQYGMIMIWHKKRVWRFINLTFLAILRIYSILSNKSFLIKELPNIFNNISQEFEYVYTQFWLKQPALGLGYCFEYKVNRKNPVRDGSILLCFWWWWAWWWCGEMVTGALKGGTKGR